MSTPEPDEELLTIPELLATDITKSASRAAPAVLDLAAAISEVELRTQIAGASTLTLTLIDPDWVIYTSGFLDVDDAGLLDTVEVNFPSGSDSWWRLCAVDITTELSSPNLTLTFEDRIVAYLRDHWGPKIAKAGTTTRAHFLKQLVDEVGHTGEVTKITFVCPSINVVQPVQADSTETVTTTEQTPAGKATTTTKVKTPAGAEAAAARVNKSPGPVTQQSFALDLLRGGGWPISQQNVQAIVGWENAEGGHFHNDAKYNPLNTTQPEPGAGNTGSQGNIKVYTSWRQGLQATLQTLNNGNYPGILAALTKGDSAAAVGQAIVASPWGTGSLVLSTIASAKVSTSDSGTSIGILPPGPAGAGPAKSDVGQLQRGTTDDPDEDSWDCGTRLAQQVDWFWFTNASALYYMDGPDLIAQQAALSLDRRIDEDRALIVSFNATFDNTSFVHSSTRSVKGKVKRKSRNVRPASPSEAQLSLICPVDAYRAGDVLVLHGMGSSNGRWIVSDATRNVFADQFTTFTLVLPTDPTPEPAAGTDTAAATAAADPLTGNGSVAGAAKQALAEKDKYVYSEGANRGNGGTLFGPAPRTMDCSAFATLCYKHAGAPDPSGFNYSPIGNTTSIIAKCRKTSTPAPGDFCFFGSSPSATTHVTIYIGNGQAISMGRQGDPEQGPAATTGPAGFLGYYTLDPSK